MILKLFKIFIKNNFTNLEKIIFIKDRLGHDRRYALNSINIIKKS